MIIINADDFGYSPGVNAAIARAFHDGLISSATLIANAPAFEEACATAAKMGFADHVGIHLNFTEGQALTRSIRECPVFCRPDGSLCFERMSHPLLSGVEIAALREEAEAQIRRCRAAGLPLSHADSHHHSHTELAVFFGLLPVLRRNGIKYLRLTDNVRRSALLRTAYKFSFNTMLKFLGLRGSDYFTDFPNLPRLGKRLMRDDLVIEVMVHPVLSADGRLIDADSKTPLADLAATLPPASRLGSYVSLGRA